MFIYTELWKLGVMFLVDEVSKERLKMGGYSNSRPLPDTTYSAIVVILSKLLSYLDNDPQNNTARVSAASLSALLNFVKLNLCVKFQFAIAGTLILGVLQSQKGCVSVSLNRPIKGFPQFPSIFCSVSTLLLLLS